MLTLCQGGDETKGPIESTANAAPVSQRPSNDLPFSVNFSTLFKPRIFRSRRSANIIETTQGPSLELTECTNAFLAEEMPQDRRAQTFWRLKMMILEIQRHPDCKQFLELK